MNLKKKYILITALATLIALPVFAIDVENGEALSQENDGMNNLSSSEENQREDLMQSASTSNTQFQRMGQNILDTARQAKKKEKKGSGMNKAIGGALMAAGAALLPNPPTTSIGVMMIMKGLSALAQSGNHSGSAAGSGMTMGAVDYNAPDFGQYGNGGSRDFAKGAGNGTKDLDPLNNKKSPTYKYVKSSLLALKKHGYNVDTKKGIVETPNGKKIDLNKPLTTQGLANAGFSLATSKAADKLIDKIVKKAEKKFEVQAAKESFEQSGGGQKSNLGKNHFDDDFNEDDLFSTGSNKKTVNRESASVVGLYRMMGDSPIGVAGNDLFEMIQRRYRLKRKQHSFVEDRIH